MAYGLNPVALPKPTPPRKHVATVPAPVAAPPPAPPPRAPKPAAPKPVAPKPVAPPAVPPPRKTQEELDDERDELMLSAFGDDPFKDATDADWERYEDRPSGKSQTQPKPKTKTKAEPKVVFEEPKSPKKFKLKSKGDPYAGYTGKRNKDGTPNKSTKEGKAWYAAKK